MTWDLGAQQVEVVLIDSDRLFREALAAILAREGVAVVSAGASPAEALPVGTWPGSSEALKLLIMDFSDPSPELGQFLARIVSGIPSVKVAVLSRQHRAEQIRLALEFGCCACLTKDISLEAFQGYFRLVIAGERMLSWEFADALQKDAPKERPRAGGEEDLTEREAVILQHLTVGASNKAIARSLGLSAATVKANVKMIFRKLHIGNRTEAAAWAVRRGFDTMAEVPGHVGTPNSAGLDPAGRDPWLASTLARRYPAPEGRLSSQPTSPGSARAA